MRARTVEELITIEEAARRWSVSRDTIERMLTRGDITAVPMGARRRVSVQSMQDYIDRERIDSLRELRAEHVS